jgi:glutathione S-transferase
MIELYFASTPNAQRALLALCETETTHVLRRVNLHAGEQRRPAFLALNPVGAVPVMVDSDGPDGRALVLAQSIAIMWYVAERAGRLIPRDPSRRWAMLQWLMLTGADVAGTNTAANQLVRSAPDTSPANVAFFEARLHRYFAACDAQLASSRYLVGELSLADLSLYPFFAARRARLGDDLPHLRAWADELARRPATVQAMTA